jgi:ankyrin repeat protein
MLPIVSLKRPRLEEYNENDTIKRNKTENSNTDNSDIEVEVNGISQSTFTNAGESTVSNKTTLHIKVKKIVLSQIWHSAKNNNWKEVEELLKNASIEEMNATPLLGPDRGITLLWFAATYKQWDIVSKIIELNPKVNFEASPAEGPHRGITLLWCAAANQKWDLVRKIIELNPKVNFEASPVEGPARGKTPLWFAAGDKQWDIVSKIIELNPRVNFDASPAEGPDKGVTLLWIAATYKQWDLVNNIIELNPKVNFDASPVGGPEGGKTVLLFAAANQKWDLVRKIIELNPKVNFEASPVEGPHRGKTPLWFAAGDKQWDIVHKIIELNPKVNFEASPVEGPGRGITVLWFAASYQQWDIVSKIIELNPKVNFDSSPGEWQPGKGPSVLKIIQDNLPGNKDLSAVMSYLIVLGIKGPIGPNLDLWEARKISISKTFDRIVTSLDDRWNNPSIFQQLPVELIDRIIREVINMEQPELNSFPKALLIEKIEEHAILMYEANHAVALRNTAVLAFNEFRWQNGLSDYPFTKSQIEDFHRLIITCLEGFEKVNKEIQYTDEIRQRLVKEIGKDQNVKHPKLKQFFIEEAIKKVIVERKEDMEKI